MMTMMRIAMHATSNTLNHSRCNIIDTNCVIVELGFRFRFRFGMSWTCINIPIHLSIFDVVVVVIVVIVIAINVVFVATYFF